MAGSSRVERRFGKPGTANVIMMSVASECDARLVPCDRLGMSTFVIDAPLAIDLVTRSAVIPPEHSLTAPTLLRSQALALVYDAVRRGRIDERTGREVLDGIRGLRIRLLGDRSLQQHAWRIAAELDWPDTYRAEYIALTRLQADAFVTADAEFASTAARFVEIATPDDLLGPWTPSRQS